MSAVPVKAQPAKTAEGKTETGTPTENNRRGKMSDLAKYTDVKRTSSASFKPPMSKDNLVKPPIQPPQKDSSWFAPFSYIKTMFVSKPVATTSSTPGDKSHKSDQINNMSHNLKSNLKDAGKYKKYIRDTDSDTKANDRAPALGTEGKEGNLTSLTSSNDIVTAARSKSPSFSVSPKDAITKRDMPKQYSTAGLFDDEDVDPTVPKYKKIQSVDNQSTYLHAPDKKGTTSFRITTVPQVGLKQLPTLLSPSFSSQAQQKRPVKLNRKGSTSPHKTRTDIGSARLRSKSTPDSSSIKPRPKVARGYMFNPVDRSPPSTHEQIKKISSWHSQQEYKRKLLTQREEAAKKEKEKEKEKIQREQSSSPLSFFTKFMSPKHETPQKINTPRKDNPFNKSNDKLKKNSQTKVESSDSPTKVLENAMEALTSKFSEFTNTSEPPKPKEETKNRRSRPGSYSPTRGRTLQSNEKAKSDAKDEPKSSPLQSTITMISSLVETIQSSMEDSKKSETNSKSNKRPSRLEKRPSKVEVEPVGAARSQNAEADTINESRSEYFHRRPGDPAAYNIIPRKRSQTYNSNSLTGINGNGLNDMAHKKQTAAGTSPQKSTQKEPEPAQEVETDEMTLASAFQKLSSLVQSKLSPLMDQQEREKVVDEAKHEANETQSRSPTLDQPENNHFYYLKKSKATESNTKLARDDSSEPPKVESSFLKSRKETSKQRQRKHQSRSRSPSPLRNAPRKSLGESEEESRARPKPNSLSTYKRSPSPVSKVKHHTKKLSPYRGGSPSNGQKRPDSPHEMSSTMSRRS